MTDPVGMAPGHHWRESDRVAEYLDRTDRDHERTARFGFMTQLVAQPTDTPIRILDIGSGHGVVAAAFLETFPRATAIGLDISEPMMAEGNRRMRRFGERFSYVRGDFGGGNLPDEIRDRGPYDVVVSARAIHHLTSQQIECLYAEVYRVLNPVGCFFNFDAAAPSDDFLKNLFRTIRRGKGVQRRRDSNIRALAEGETHSQDTTLLDHLRFLESAGFTSVDCFHKHLAQAVVGGYKYLQG